MSKKAKQHLKLHQSVSAMDTLNWIVCLREDLDTGHLFVHITEKHPDKIVSEVDGGEFYRAPTVTAEFRADLDPDEID